MHCDRFVALIGAYVEDELAEAERSDFQEHLRQCRGCQQIAMTEEPTLLFATLKRSEPTPERVDACVSAVGALIHQDRLQQRLRPRVPRWVMAVAAVGVIVVGAAIMWHTSQIGNPASLVAPIEVAVEATEQEVVPPRVEVDMAGEGVRVYQFAQEEDENTAVYFVVNSAMEL